jgi:hypothetical protein
VGEGAMAVRLVHEHLADLNLSQPVSPQTNTSST